MVELAVVALVVAAVPVPVVVPAVVPAVAACGLADAAVLPMFWYCIIRLAS